MTNNARIGGILSIVSGGLGILGIIMGVLVGAFFVAMPFRSFEGGGPPEQFFNFFIVIWVVMGLISIAISALAIVGGVYALKKRYWGLALAGAIAGTISFFVTGIPAIIFIAIGKPEFIDQPPASTPPPYS